MRALVVTVLLSATLGPLMSLGAGVSFLVAIGLWGLVVVNLVKSAVKKERL